MIKKFILLATVLLTACTASAPVLEKPMHRAAMVDSAEVLILESWPLQARLAIRGNFRDGCERLADVSSERVGNLFQVAVSVGSSKPGEFCTQALMPFEEVLDLDILGLEAGEYLIEVNGAEMASFVLDRDNRL